jgi:hypothetical protein
MRVPNDADIVRLLTGYYQEVVMETTFRRQLLADTGRIVGIRVRQRTKRLAFSLAAAAAAVVASFLIWHFAQSPHATAPKSSVIASAPGRGGAAPGPQEPSPSAGAVGGSPRENGKTADAGIAAASGHTPETGEAAPVPGPLAPFLTVAAVRQPSSTNEGGLKVGDRLSPGAVVRTGPSGRVTLVTKKGSEVTLNEKSELGIASRQATRLISGEIFCRSRAGEIKQIATAGGTIELLGTALDAALQDGQGVAVTVIHGKVRLANAHGEVIVDAGRKSLLIASLPPGSGVPADIPATTAWYDGRGTVLSDFGDIAYTFRRSGMFTEIWTMKADGSGKRHVKSYLGYGMAPGMWLPGEEWLLFNSDTLIWTAPNLNERRADSSAGHPIVEGRAWLVNAATGEDAPFALPAGYDPLYMAISPDTRLLAFPGRYQPDPKSQEGMEGGVFVFDLVTGGVKRVLEGWIKTAPAWVPDSRRLVASAGEGYGTNYPLVVVDVDSGEVTDLKVQGAGASFSPDGTKVAYCGDFKGSGSWFMGVPTSGSIWVLSLKPGGTPVRISPEGEGALQPHWSPDGNRVAYRVNNYPERKAGEERTNPGYAVYVAQVDGSGVQEIYRKDPGPEKGFLQAASWSPSDNAIYLSTDQGVMLVAADGSGEVTNLGGNETDSVLTPEEQEATDAAILSVREGIFQYAVGQVRAFEGKPKESDAACSAAADIFASLPYDYPLVKFSLNDVLGYTDKASALASRGANEILDKSCQERQRYLSILLTQYAAAKNAFPPDLAALEKYSLESNWGINWISNQDTEWVKMVLRCPADGGYQYNPPATGKDPEIGDVLVTCPSHPANRLAWTERTAQDLQWRRQSAAMRAAGK